jgi:hypothetical protein
MFLNFLSLERLDIVELEKKQRAGWISSQSKNKLING